MQVLLERGSIARQEFGKGASAEQQAWAHLSSMVHREALSLSFIANFWRLVWIFAAVIPFVLLLGRREHRTEMPADRRRSRKRDCPRCGAYPGLSNQQMAPE